MMLSEGGEENSISHVFAASFNDKLSVLGPHVPQARSLKVAKRILRHVYKNLEFQAGQGSYLKKHLMFE